MYTSTPALPEAGHQLFWTTNDTLGDFAVMETPTDKAFVSTVVDGEIDGAVALRVADWDEYVALNRKGDATNEDYATITWTLVLPVAVFEAATFM